MWLSRTLLHLIMSGPADASPKSGRDRTPHLASPALQSVYGGRYSAIDQDESSCILPSPEHWVSVARDGAQSPSPSAPAVSPIHFTAEESSGV